MTSFSYDCIKKQLKAIYDGISQKRIATPVKDEPTYEVNGYGRYGKDGYYNRGKSSSSFGGGKVRGRFNRGGHPNTTWRYKEQSIHQIHAVTFHNLEYDSQYFIGQKNDLIMSVGSQVKIK